MPPTRNWRDILLSSIVSKIYEIPNTIGIPPIAPASFGPLNFAIVKIIAVTPAEAKLFNMMSIVTFYVSKGGNQFRTTWARIQRSASSTAVDGTECCIRAVMRCRERGGRSRQRGTARSYAPTLGEIHEPRR